MQRCIFERKTATLLASSGREEEIGEFEIELGGLRCRESATRMDLKLCRVALRERIWQSRSYVARLAYAGAKHLSIITQTPYPAARGRESFMRTCVHATLADSRQLLFRLCSANFERLWYTMYCP